MDPQRPAEEPVAPLPPQAGQGDATRFVLVNTSHAGNVGAAARAMKVMGFRDLVLVQPRFADVLQRDEARAFASGAEDLLQRARVVGALDEALVGITHVCATAMTPRDFGPVAQDPRSALQPLARQGERVAFVFGSERFGLANEDVWRCHQVISIPTHPDYGSLNLAQAVQLIAWEWRQALGGYPVVGASQEPSCADAAAVQGVLQHWRRALEAVGYLDPRAPKKLMPRLNQLANRLRLSQEEVHILRGIARAMVDTAERAGQAAARSLEAAGPDPEQPPAADPAPKLKR